MLTHLESASTTSPHPHPTVLLHDSRAYGPLQVALGLLLDIRVPVLEGSFAFLAMLSPHEDSRAHRLELPWLVMVSPSEADTSFATVPIPPPSSKISTLGWRREHLSCASRRLGKVWSYQIRPLSERYQARYFARTCVIRSQSIGPFVYKCLGLVLSFRMAILRWWLSERSRNRDNHPRRTACRRRRWQDKGGIRTSKFSLSDVLQFAGWKGSANSTPSHVGWRSAVDVTHYSTHRKEVG